MATFSPKRIDLQSINNGIRYQSNDGISAEAINAPIEASAYSQELSETAHQKADEALNTVHDVYTGTVTLSAYPIGSIYSSTMETSPAELFGGSWEEETRYLEYIIHDTKVFPSSADGRYWFATNDEIKTLFNNKYGITLSDDDFSAMSFNIYNGDLSSSASVVSNVVRSIGGNEYIFHSDATTQIRVNYSCSFSRKDPQKYWRRVA